MRRLILLVVAQVEVLLLASTGTYTAPITTTSITYNILIIIEPIFRQWYNAKMSTMAMIVMMMKQ
jgi:hypothetical protein